MKNWTIGKRITLGFGAVLLIMLILNGFVESRVQVVQAGTLAITTNNMVSLRLLADVKEALNETRVLTFKHISSPNVEDMKHLEAKIAENADRVTKDLEECQPTASSASQKLLALVKIQREQYLIVRSQILSASRAATNAAASAAVYQTARTQLDPVVEAYARALTQCQDQETTEAKETSDATLAAVRSTKLGLIVGAAVALALSAGLGFLIIRNTTSILRRISGTLAGGADQVTSAAGQVTRRRLSSTAKRFSAIVRIAATMSPNPRWASSWSRTIPESPKTAAPSCSSQTRARRWPVERSAGSTTRPRRSSGSGHPTRTGAAGSGGGCSTSSSGSRRTTATGA